MVIIIAKNYFGILNFKFYIIGTIAVVLAGAFTISVYYVNKDKQK